MAYTMDVEKEISALEQEIPGLLRAKGIEGLELELPHLLEHKDKSEQYILYQNNAQLSLLKADVSQTPYLFWYIDKNGYPSSANFQNTVAQFIWENSEKQQFLAANPGVEPQAASDMWQEKTFKPHHYRDVSLQIRHQNSGIFSGNVNEFLTDTGPHTLMSAYGKISTMNRSNFEQTWLVGEKPTEKERPAKSFLGGMRQTLFGGKPQPPTAKPEAPIVDSTNTVQGPKK